MIIQRLFSSKAQKARRRAYDLQQGSSARFAIIEPLFDHEDNKKILSNAQEQDKMIGRKKTMDLIKKGENSVVGSSEGVMSRIISYDPTKIKNRKELEEIKRARNLLSAGRFRQQFSRDNIGKCNLNDIINIKENGNGIIDINSKCMKSERKNAVEKSKITNPRRVKESIAKHEAKVAELRAKKAAAKKLKTAGKIGIGVAGAAGIGYGIKKAVDKKKKKEEEHN